MAKKIIFGVILVGILLLGANSLSANPKVGIQIIPGNTGLSFPIYSENYGGGFWGSYQKVDSSPKTVLGCWAEIRQNIAPQTYFAYGLNYDFAFGQVGGVDLDYAISTSPYLSFQYNFTENFMITLWSELVSYSKTKYSAQTPSERIDLFKNSLAFSYFF
jgi:hypothetical protein